MAKNNEPGLVRKIVGIPSNVAKHPFKATLTAVKIAVIGTAVLGAGMYLYTTFSPKYESGADVTAGIEKIAADATNAFTDAKQIVGYESNEPQPEYGK